MASDPFAEPSDNEGTVFRPRPAGTAPSTTFRDTAQPARPIPKIGDNPLVAAAAPVLAAAIRIVNRAGQPPDPDKLRQAMVKAIRGFESDALATGLDTRSLRAARYALCATIDDLVLSTPWGSQSSWVQHSITSVFHNEVIGGERFFDILEQMQTDLGHHSAVVELMYLCTSLGFEGRYRVMPRGVAALNELRDGVYRTLRQRRGDFERELSPHWHGIAAGARNLANRIPLWARALGTFAIACCMYLAFSFLLSDVSDTAFAELFSLQPKQAFPVAHVPVRAPAAPTPTPTPTAAAVPARSAFSQRLRQFLAPEIRAGLVQVFEDAQTVTIRLTNRQMFASGGAVLGASYPALLVRIGDALETEPGKVSVRGYTDNQPIRTARFPSNFELSQARADVVTAALRARLKDPARVTAQGKGDSDPIASNATQDGRQQNRRTEIVLIRPSDAL
jgi:type VI secretion system protein ImpK